MDKKRVARKPAINEDALAKLGVAKLARLIVDEAGRNPTFRKLVTATLAAAKGPEAVAGVIDKRLASLERTKGFVDWPKAKEFAADLANTVVIIVSEIGGVDADGALDRLVRFLMTAGQVLNRIDDSSGRIQSIYGDAASALAELVAKVGEDRRASLPDRFHELALSDECDFFCEIMPKIIALLPRAAIDSWDARLEKEIQSLGPIGKEDRDWERQIKANRIIGLRQTIADQRKDVDAFISLERSRSAHRVDRMAIAERLLDAGRFEEALESVRQAGQSAQVSSSHAEGLARIGVADESDLYRTRLEVRILQTMGDEAAAQALRWRAFEATLDAGLLRDHIAHLADFEEFDVLDRAFAHASSFALKYSALAFLLKWPRLDLAARLVLDRREQWEGRHYGLLVPAAETLEPDHPTEATILYRALLDDILDRARSPAYGYGARYLAKLDVMAPHVDGAVGIETHERYREGLTKKHGRKWGFWSLVKPGS
ncbi:MAG: DUF6880 family protein [Methylocystis sp.]